MDYRKLNQSEPIECVHPFTESQVRLVQQAAEAVGVEAQVFTDPDEAGSVMRDFALSLAHGNFRSTRFMPSVEVVANGYEQTGRECAEKGGAVVRLVQMQSGKDLGDFWGVLDKLKAADAED